MGYYKEMIEQARGKGIASEAMMWSSIEEVDSMLEKMKDHHKEMYWAFMHNQHKAIYKGHYNEEFAEYELGNVYYINKAGEKTNKPYWTVEEFREFEKAIIDKRDAWLGFNILFWTGIRLGELLALTVSDFDFEKGTMTIDESYTKLDGEDLITAPKTESSNRKITIPKFLKGEIKEYLDRQYELAPEDRIFPITDRAVQKKMKQKSF